MNKELEAFKRIKYKLSSSKANGYWEDLDIIETALERNIELEQRNLILTNLKTTSMINKKPLSNLFSSLSQEERYKYIEHIYYTYSEVKEELDCLKLAYQKAVSDNKAKEKKLKALEIIIEKNIDLKTLKEAFIFNGNNKEQCEMYNLNQWQWVFELEHPGCINTNKDKLPELTQEEYDLLKEMLRNDND